MNSHPTVASVWVTMSPGAFQKFAIFVVEILDGETLWEATMVLILMMMIENEWRFLMLTDSCAIISR